MKVQVIMTSYKRIVCKEFFKIRPISQSKKKMNNMVEDDLFVIIDYNIYFVKKTC